MEEMFALFGAGDDDDDDDVEGQAAYGGNGGTGLDMVGEVQVEEEVGEEEEEENEDEEDAEDADLELSELELRPLKRSRSSRGGISQGALLFGGDDGRRSGSTGRGQVVGGHGEQEVIEIFSDDDEAQQQQEQQQQLLSGFHSDPVRPGRHSVESCPGRQRQHNRSPAAASEGSSSSSSAAAAATGAGARSSRHSVRCADQQGGPKGYHPSAAPGRLMTLRMAAGGSTAGSHKPAGASSAAAGVSASNSHSSVVVQSWISSSVLGVSEEGEEGKRSEEGKASREAGQADADRSGWLGAAVLTTTNAGATSNIHQATGDDEESFATTMSSDQAGPLSGSATPGTTAAAAAAAAAAEFPLNLECAMCFNPLAVAALFACGHGSCWECAHDWCSRDTSPTMDCPTCHVSVPRNDFRRCVVLDQVVDRAVLAAGMDDDEWRARLQRGQQLAREAESNRRDSRDNQRSAEDTIAKQAAELEKLRKEAKSRVLERRSVRSYEQGFPPSMADYGFRLMGGGARDVLDPASHKSAIEEITRFRHRRAEAGEPESSSRDARASGDAAVVAAAALGMPPSAAYGGARPRGPTHPGFGPAEGDPWFSLRSSQPGRYPSVAMSAGRMGREMLGRTHGLSRSAGNSAAGMGLVHPHLPGSALKSSRELASGGSNWRSAYLEEDRLLSSGAGGARTLHHLSVGSRGSPVGHVRGGAALERGPPVTRRGDPTAHASSSACFSSKRFGISSGAGSGGAFGGVGAAPSASSSSHPLVGGVGGGGGGGGGSSPSPSPQRFDGFGGQGQREHSSRGGGGGGGVGHFVSRGRGNGRAEQPTPALDLEELMSGQDDPGSRSEWDDVLASISMPHVGADRGMGRSEEPPGTTRG
ncbi:unnamed protein product [Pylaiella littoralis]